MSKPWDNNQTAERLMSALSSLDAAIRSAQKHLTSRGEAAREFVTRLGYYEEVVRRQKMIAEAMLQAKQAQNWADFTRHAELLRGSSSMIQLDIVSLLKEIAGEAKATESYAEVVN